MHKHVQLIIKQSLNQSLKFLRKRPESSVNTEIFGSTILSALRYQVLPVVPDVIVLRHIPQKNRKTHFKTVNSLSKAKLWKSSSLNVI